jgi:hypothetical protein
VKYASDKGHNSLKNRQTGKFCSHAHLPTIILLCVNFSQNLLRNVGGVHKKLWTDEQTDDIMTNIPFGKICRGVKIDESENPDHMRTYPIIILLCGNFGQNPLRNVGGVAFTRNYGAIVDGQTNERTTLWRLYLPEIVAEG